MGGDPLKPLVVLGATGSIGRQTIDVAERIGAPIHAIAARSASDDLLALGQRLPDALVFVVDPGDRRDAFSAEFGERLHLGPGSITSVAATPDVTVVNGIVGAAGLAASLSALYAGNRLALANKESLVAGGPLIDAAVQTEGAELVPIDSEHSAIWQCLVGEDVSSVRRVVLTASGGPFRGAAAADLVDVTPDQALAHPTWSMGARISIDSATLMNKAFEVIEAHHLFGFTYDQVDVVVHPQSVVHSFVEFVDGVVKAEVGKPDMRKPIQYAITAPDRIEAAQEPMNLVGTDLTFEEVDRDVFRCLDLGYAAGRTGGTAPAVLNAADEVAVAAFLDGRLPFPGIADVVESTLELHEPFMPTSLDDVRAVDEEARAHAAEACVAYASVDGTPR